MKNFIRTLLVLTITFIGINAVAMAQSSLTKVGAGTLILPSSATLQPGINTVRATNGGYLTIRLDSFELTNRVDSFAITSVMLTTAEGATARMRKTHNGTSADCTGNGSCWEEPKSKFQMTFCLSSGTEPGTAIIMLIPAIQKVREAAARQH